MNVSWITVSALLPLLVFQEPVPSSPNTWGSLEFRRISSQNGLSQSTVWSIGQDAQGFIWLGTEDGLNKHDGYRFSVLRQMPELYASLTDNRVLSMTLDGSNNLWVGTKNGLNRINPVTMDVQHFFAETTAGLTANYIRCLLRDQQGQILIGTYEGGLCRLDPQTQIFQEIPGIPLAPNDHNIRALCLDENERLWIATNNGLLGYLTESDVLTYNQDQGLSHAQVRSLSLGANGELWVGTTRGLNFIDTRTGKLNDANSRFAANHALGTAWINVIKHDSFGRVWIGTVDGLWLIDESNDQSFHYKHDPYSAKSLAGNDVLDVYADRTGLVWVSSYQNGLSILDTKPPKFRLVQNNARNPKALIGERVYALFKDQEGSLWVGTEAGLSKSIDLSEFELVSTFSDVAQSRASTSVQKIVQDQEGDLWIGTYYGGLHCLNPKTGELNSFVEEEGNAQSLCDNTIQEILIEANSLIWIGTRQGLCRHRKGSDSFELIHSDLPGQDNLVSRSIKVIARGQEGSLWLGTYARGLIRLSADTHKATVIGHDPKLDSSLDHASVSCLLEQTDGFWVGTAQGLNFVNAHSLSVTRTGRQMGLPVTPIHGMIADGNGALWLSTNNGLYRVDPYHNQYKVFDITDGLQDNEFLDGAAFKDPKGNLYFGGLDGFNTFHPSRIEDNQHVPNVIITSMKVHGIPTQFEEAASQGKPLHFNHDLNFISFEFAALDFTFPKNNEFAFKLDGIDQDWVQAGTQNYTSYTQLPSGSYRFRVMGSNNDGIWNDNEAIVEFKIHPPIWRTWWAYSLYFLGIVALAASFHFLRLRSLRERERELKQLVRQRTTHLEETQKKLVETAHRAGMAEISTGVLHNVGNILNSTNISVEHARKIVAQSNITGFWRANEMLKGMENEVQLNPKGKKLIQFYETLAQGLKKEQDAVQHELDQLLESVRMMREIIEIQHDYAQSGLLIEELSPAEFIGEVLALMHVSMERHAIDVHVHELSKEPCLVTRTKIVNVLVNLIENAKDAVDGNPSLGKPKRLEISTSQTLDGKLEIEVHDNGYGILAENMDHVFTFGFTTKAKGHGYGLHTSANAMTEMGGSLRIESDGPDCGTSAIMQLPVVQVTAVHNSASDTTSS